MWAGGCCKVRCMCLSVLSAFLILSHCVDAATPAETDSAVFSLDANSILTFFCDYALLIDRGVTHSPLGGTPEDLITENIKRNVQLQKFLNLTEGQLKELSTPAFTSRIVDPKAAGSTTPDNTIEVDKPHKTTNGFEAILNDEQMTKLPLLYLNLEGLKAISRPEFRALINITRDEQKAVRELATAASDRSYAIHRGIFSMRNNQMSDLPKLNLELRQMSAELDRKILDLLSDAERMRLAGVVVQAAAIASFIQGPGAGSSMELLNDCTMKVDGLEIENPH